MNLPIALVDAAPSAYVVLENQTPKDIRMDGWRLTGQDSPEPYEFAHHFVWKGKERLAIAQDVDACPSGEHRLLEADEDFMGRNTILRLTNRAGTLVAEWSLA